MTDISTPEEGPHVPDTVALLEAQAKRIAFLEALISETNTYYAECIDTREALRARIAELKAALKPFADIKIRPEFYNELTISCGVSIADLRAARAALEKKND